MELISLFVRLFLVVLSTQRISVSSPLLPCFTALQIQNLSRSFIHFLSSSQSRDYSKTISRLFSAFSPSLPHPPRNISISSHLHIALSFHQENISSPHIMDITLHSPTNKDLILDNNNNNNNNTKRAPNIKDITFDQLYNLPIFESYLIIDTRTQIDYNLHHIHSSINCPPPIRQSLQEWDIARERDRQLVLCLNELVEAGLQPEHSSPIVVYGEIQTGDRAHLDYIAQRFATLANEPLDCGSLLPEVGYRINNQRCYDDLYLFYISK